MTEYHEITNMIIVEGQVPWLRIAASRSQTEREYLDLVNIRNRIGSDILGSGLMARLERLFLKIQDDYKNI